MTLDPQASTLYAFREAGIISPSNYRRALAHPQYSELAECSEPAQYLVWLVIRDIISEEQLHEAYTRVTATSTGDEFQPHEEALGTAVLMLGRMRDNFNQQWFDELVAQDLITPAERDLAVEHASSDNVLASPAAALAYLALSKAIDADRLSAAAVSAASGKRAEILAEARDIHTRTNAAVRDAVIGAILPGPRWLWIAAPVLVVGFVIWRMVTPVTVPDCTERDVARTIDSMLFKVSLDARVANPFRYRDKGPPTPTVHDIKEVGLATETGVRGCLATLKVDADEIPYAFTIAPAKEEDGGKGGFTVTGAEPAIVQARYGNLDAEGAFRNKAEPIGRADVERAFRSGAESMRTAPLPYGAGLGQRSTLSSTAPERKREIAEVEPMGPCREVKPGTVYSCRLIVERNDTLLAAIGAGSSTVIDSAFTFERDGTTGPWRVSAAFTEEYQQAVATARVRAVRKPAP